MTKHPRQRDIDALVETAVKAGLPAWEVVLKEVNGKIEPALIVVGGPPLARGGEVELG